VTSLLQVDKITKSFGAVRALREVSFELHAGEVHALLGENGAGKSTLIKVITGAYAPDSGSVSLHGKPVRHFNPREAHRLGIACVYQQPALFPDLSVAENVALRLSQPRAFTTVSRSAQRENARALLRRIGAEIDPEREIRSLSMPDQQLVEIACAIGSGARIVIMDEPTASLTQKEQHLLFAVVRELRKSGVGVIYISHRLEEIFALADRVTVLRDGESVGTNRIDDIDESKLIALMVGREMTQLYPPAEGHPGEVVLKLNEVGCSECGVHRVSLELRAGEIVGFAGLVGAGRTELARVIFGITPADRGTIELRGQPVTISEPREAIALGIGYVPEDRRRHGVILEMPIAQNITMAVHRTLFPGAWLRLRRESELAQGYIQELGIKATGPDAPGETLSGGNQQKVSVARWLATKPSVLILDEPTQGVDVGAKSEIHRIIRLLAKEGLAVLMISSDLPEILGMSDRIAVMRGGTITAMLPGGSDAHEVMAAALGQTKAAA
jgi:rhamnose transport system ATP-binding protein